MYLLLESQSRTVINGMWLLTGIFVFFVIEKVFPDDDEDDEKNKENHANRPNIDVNNNSSSDSKGADEQKSLFCSIKVNYLMDSDYLVSNCTFDFI